MPSQNTEGNMIIMDWTKKSSSEDDDLGSKVDVGDYYFYYNQTQNYFPTLRFHQDSVPFGNSLSYCIHLEWSKKEMKSMIDMYKHVQGFEMCSNAKNPKFRWQASDPKMGVDFQVWKQKADDSTGDSDCSAKGGVYRDTNKTTGSYTGKCYTYQVLKHICLMIAFVEHPESNSYSWEYRGGCYGTSDEVAYYE